VKLIDKRAASQRLRAQGVDGIVLDPNDVRALTAAVNDVLESGIPVVSFDRSLEGANKPVPFFCLDNVAGAAALAVVIEKSNLKEADRYAEMR
jgi:ABC-type sugar transport system substrate-binding protein